MDKVRVGLVGLSQGYYATTYSREVARRMKDADLVVVCDLGRPDDYVLECAGITAGALAEELGVPVCSNLEDLPAFGLDAVIVTSEIAEHADHAAWALEHGLHCFVGKPLAVGSADVVKVMEAAGEGPLVVLPGEPARYEDGILQVVQAVREGRVGLPVMTRVFVNHPAMEEQAWERDEARSGGPLGEFGTYCCDILRWVVGAEAAQVFAYGGSFSRGRVWSWDNIKGVLRFANGCVGSMDLCCSIDWPYPFLDLEVVGEDGVARTDYHNYAAVTHTRRGVALGEIRYSPMNPREIRHFVDCVRGLASPAITLEDALAVTKMLEALRASLDTNRPVNVA